MVNINGKDWSHLETIDIQAVLSEQDFDESFYFEFKDDKATTKKLMEEVSVFAYTFGGYIFIGISDDKQIEGCTSWNEQRIHTTLHDSITPTPSFDVKKFTCNDATNDATVYVIRIDEGSEPPYITSSGKIYERLSSGSFTILDSVRLSQIYNKREQFLSKLERKISIPAVAENTSNIYGYRNLIYRHIRPDIGSIELTDLTEQTVTDLQAGDMVYVEGFGWLEYQGPNHCEYGADIIDKNMKKKNLRLATGMSTTALAKLGKNQHVSTEILVKICKALDCDFCDIIELVKDDGE